MADGRRITIKDIAKKTGVSARTVAHVLNNTGRISIQTRERVAKEARRLNYHPNVMARGLVNRKTYLAGVVVPYLTTSFFANIISGIEEASLENHYDILLGNASSDLRSDRDTIRRMVDRKVDGIICCPDPRHDRFYRDLTRTGIPLIQIMTHLQRPGAPSILVDDIQGGFLATSHLLELGHRRIAFIGYEAPFYREISLRWEGYLQALSHYDIALDQTSYRRDCDLSVDGAYEATRELLKETPGITAIFAATDLAAIGTIRACLDAGKAVPDDLSVVGFDDVDAARYQTAHPLTTISQPKEKVGRLAFQALLALIQGEPVESLTLSPSLIVRNTTAPV